MDLEAEIRQLKIEKLKLELVIAQMEQLQNTDVGSIAATVNRRGRKSMGPEERQRVSERMKQYWANRKQ